MARDYKGTSQKAEKQGNAVGGGPVGSGGGYSGRPGGSTPQKPGGPTRPLCRIRNAARRTCLPAARQEE